jgi:hypothetical protein
MNAVTFPDRTREFCTTTARDHVELHPRVIRDYADLLGDRFSQFNLRKDRRSGEEMATLLRRDDVGVALGIYDHPDALIADAFADVPGEEKTLFCRLFRNDVYQLLLSNNAR